MVYMKEDSSLDIERINKLPVEEFMDRMGDLTPIQVKEYLSQLQISQSHEPMQPVKVNYDRSDKRSGIDAKEFLFNLSIKIREQWFH